MKLDGKVALVTGGSQGIGACVVRRLATEGASVIALASKDAGKAEAIAREVRAAGGRAVGMAADVTQPQELARAAADVLAAHGRIDILVNSAGVFLPTPAGEADAESVDRTLDVNLKGAFLAINAVVPAMKRQGSGRIVSIASVAGLMGVGGYSMYCATKAGIVMMTRALACELAPHGINVNAIAPGNTATPMNEAVRNDPAHKGMLDAMTARTPSGRTYSMPEEMAEMALFLVSDHARPMHGSTVLMDEGFSAGM